MPSDIFGNPPLDGPMQIIDYGQYEAPRCNCCYPRTWTLGHVTFTPHTEPPRLSDEDVERIAAKVAEKLRKAGA